MTRPTASVIVPFAGSMAELGSVAGRLRSLRTRPGDQLFVVHNTAEGPGRSDLEGVSVVRAPRMAAPGYARNQAARVATGEWLVFIDADTVPAPSLLDAYFSPAPGASTAVLAGGIRDVPGGPGLAARHSVARGHMSHRVTLDRTGTPFAQTANCAVRRTAFMAVRGFDESIAAGEDADLGFRLQAAGWKLEERPEAWAEHRTRATVRALLAQLAGHGAGAAWLERRYPGEFPPLGARAIAAVGVRKTLGAARALTRREAGSAGSELLDFLTLAAFELGRRRSNQARPVAQR